ncbi:MAG: hypothetical protein L6Q99_12130 [Planctomycetes bacterium]|nr:hypothetical protein [Planctomycetota bacterium]
MTIQTILTLVLLLVPVGQDKPSAPASQPAPTASTPIYPNASCPIMGKPVSTKLFAETDKGRIYVCCKGCVKDILADVPTAYRTAFPSDKKVANKVCPVTGGEITKDSPTVVLQGFEFFVRGKENVRAAQENSQVVLAKLNDPKLVDLDNKTCPVTGDAVAKNTFVVIEGTIVRLSSAKLLEGVAKDPAKVLAKAKEIRAKEEKEQAAKQGQGEGKKP